MALAMGAHPVTPRRYHHTRPELSLTKATAVITPHLCDPNRQIVIMIPSAAQSSGKYYERRQSVRRTWAARAQRGFNISTYFAIALNSNVSVNEDIAREARHYGDVIQFAFIDHYYNLTLKTIASLRWVDHNCARLKLMVKADDDVVINVERLLQMSDSFVTGITGHKVKEEANRDLSKQSIPERYYPHRWLPDYVYGHCYVLTSDVIRPLLRTIDTYSDHILDIEDVFVTGLVAQKTQIARHWSREFEFKDNCIPDKCNLCRMSSMIAYGECGSAQELNHFYSSWINSSQALCLPYCSSERSATDRWPLPLHSFLSSLLLVSTILKI